MLVFRVYCTYESDNLSQADSCLLIWPIYVQLDHIFLCRSAILMSWTTYVRISKARWVGLLKGNRRAYMSLNFALDP